MAEYIERDKALASIRYEDPAFAYAIERIPAADVRPVVRGIWVKNGWSVRCSICGYDMPFATRNFCPNCGAMMEEN